MRYRIIFQAIVTLIFRNFYNIRAFVIIAITIFEAFKPYAKKTTAGRSLKHR
jgi:hypothetical protein